MVGLIYTQQSSGKPRKNKSKKLQKATAEHKKFLAKHGLSGGPIKKIKGIIKAPNLREGLDRGTPTSDVIPTGIIERVDIFNDHKWKRGKVEKQSTIDAIAQKAAAVAPAYNKGGLVYNLDTPEERRKR